MEISHVLFLTLLSGADCHSEDDRQAAVTRPTETSAVLIAVSTIIGQRIQSSRVHFWIGTCTRSWYLGAVSVIVH